MGKEINTVFGAVGTVGCGIASVVTFGKVECVNESMACCANFTAENAQQTVVRHAGETVINGAVTAIVAVPAGVCLGLAPCLNKAVVSAANDTADATIRTGKAANFF